MQSVQNETITCSWRWGRKKRKLKQAVPLWQNKVNRKWIETKQQNTVDPKWPLTTTKGKSHLLFITGRPWFTCWSSIRVTLLSVLKIFTFWPLVTPNGLSSPPKTFTDYLLYMGHTHTKYEIPHGDLSKDIVLMSIFKGFHCFTSVDYNWPLTSTLTLTVRV